MPSLPANKRFELEKKEEKRRKKEEKAAAKAAAKERKKAKKAGKKTGLDEKKVALPSFHISIVQLTLIVWVNWRVSACDFCRRHALCTLIDAATTYNFNVILFEQQNMPFCRPSRRQRRGRNHHRR
jgi:hypothetical protein